MKPTDSPTTEESSEKGLTTWQVMVSILAGFFGVQKEKTRNRDFTRGKPSQFIIVGIVLTAVWYLAIYLVVKIVLHFI
jgi:hypothetical protein